ncbi:zinc ribbon domain-containing protein [Staphylococcus ratti]|uniref:Zinc ribbon domain-containing protein n=1 Tax=Staphylococcus ratti TaxID=2892440 RepID=A0ABY3PBG0_9STAP|nr:zinc ribbon domain-containing protein [Staphylococcus ratti]UEX89599.1 zinc ribbon domain-containing protein [Staphylococcus ratti]
MPNYTYLCKTCGSFTLRQSMQVSHEKASCPSCHQIAKRQFTTFQTYQMDKKLKQRIEKGQQPRRVKRDALTRGGKRANTATRPWMAGH